MTKEQKDYIEKHIDLIENGDWEIFFQNAPEGIGAALYTAGVDFMSDMKIVPQRCFAESNINSVIIPDNVTKIEQRAFENCRKLTSVSIGNGVTKIEEYAFSMFTNPMMSVHITDIAAWCKISFVTSSSNPIRSRGNLYLNGVPVTNLVIPNNVTSIGKYAFCDCSNLTSVTIGNSVTSIGEHAFSHCSSLTSVMIPDSVIDIAAYAFYSCPSLKSVVIPNSVTSIREGAFEELGSDVVINFDGTKEQWKNIYNSRAFGNTYFTVNCLDGTLHKKKR